MRSLLWVVLGSALGCTPERVAPPPPVVHHARPTLRLPAGVAPTSYAISATVVPSEATMHSTTTITVTLAQRVDRVWLHQQGLTFGLVTAQAGGKTVAVTPRPEAEHFVALELAEPLGPGEAVLTLDTTAPLSRTEGQGAFSDGEYVVTQFEPVGARRAFPVFDEPSFKVPWQLTLTVPNELVAVSNTQIEREVVDGARKTLTFARSKPMPSYLLAFGVGPFDVVDGGKAGQRQVPVRFFVPRGQGARAQWAVETTAQAIAQLEAWFGTPFPWDKADQLVVRSPSFSGAMENDGLVTWSESLLLAPPDGDDLTRRRAYLSTALHELGHHWFGDLVTAAWWDDLWLNEAFATFIEARVLTTWHPEWGGEVERVEARDEVMRFDTLGSVRRVREPIVTHDDIANAFDDITYAKGAAVLFMLERWLGPDSFRAGVQRYLARHAWKNATADDFIAALSEVSGQDVRAVLAGFLDQPGFPLVTTTLDCRGARPKVTLAQQRAQPLSAELEAPPWRLPVCVAWHGGRQCTLLDGATGVLELETTTCPAWLVGNDDFAGYYRVRPLRAALLAEPGLSAPERFGVATDLEALVERGEVSMAEQLEAVSAAAASSDRVLITHAAHFTESLWDVVPEASRPHLARFVRRKFGPRAKALGFTARAGEDEDAALLRPVLLGLVGWAGDDATVRAEALERARAWLRAHAVGAAGDAQSRKRDGLTPDVVKVTLRVAARTNDPKFFDQLLTAAAREPDAHARRLLVATLGAFSTPALARRALAFSLAEGSDPRETLALITSLAGMPETHALAVDFVKTHYAELTRALPRDWEGELVTLATSTCAADERADIEAFFAPRSTAALGGPREYANALETFDDCVAWRARVTPDLVRSLAR